MAHLGFTAILAFGFYFTAFSDFAFSQNQIRLPPVKIIKKSWFCQDLAVLKAREKLISERRSESISGLDMGSVLSGRCGEFRPGEWLFYNGWRENYICLRPRIGAECVFVKRDAVASIPVFYPGRSPMQANKGVSCEAWQKVAQASSERRQRALENYRKTSGGWQGGSKSPLCNYLFFDLSERHLELTAYLSCARLDFSKRNQLSNELNTVERTVSSTCTGR